jgi:hypothetical protein
MMRFTLKQIEYFAAAVEPSISAAIFNQKHESGIQLYVRHHVQGLSPTPRGQRFLREAKSLLLQSGGTMLRRLADSHSGKGIRMAMSPDTVAERMGEAMYVIGAVGFLVSTPFQCISRRFITEVREGLVPASRRRGLSRRPYGHTLPRDTLRES